MSVGPARHRRDAVRGVRHATSLGRHSRGRPAHAGPATNGVTHYGKTDELASSSERTRRRAQKVPSGDVMVVTEWSSRREYRASMLSRRSARVQQRQQDRADLARRIVPGVIAATVLLGAGQVLISEGSAQTADAGTEPVDRIRAEVAAIPLAPGRSAVAASRSSVRPVLTTVNASGIGQMATVHAETALTSTIAATGDVQERVRDEVDEVAEAAAVAEAEAAEAAAAEEARRAFASPIRGARITSGYGQRWGRMHNGLDFGAAQGEPLYAVADVTVTTATYNSGLGITSGSPWPTAPK